MDSVSFPNVMIEDEKAAISKYRIAMEAAETPDPLSSAVAASASRAQRPGHARG